MGKKNIQGRPAKGKDASVHNANGKGTVGTVISSKAIDGKVAVGKNTNGTKTNGMNLNGAYINNTNTTGKVIIGKTFSGTNTNAKKFNGKNTNGMKTNNKNTDGKANTGRDASNQHPNDKRIGSKAPNTKRVKFDISPPPKFFKIFPFLKLPAELRIKIYNYSFGKHVLEILPISKSSGLTSWNPSGKKPKPSVRNSKARETRGCSSRPGRPDGRLSKWPNFRSLPGLAAMLLTCKQIHRETHHLLYEQVTFIIRSQTAFHRFLTNLSPPCLATIRTLKLQHHTYGEPYLTEHQVWKDEYDSKWAALCLEAGGKMTGLKELEVRLNICDWPTELNLQARWALPLLALAGGQLEKVHVKLEMNGRCVSWQDLSACAAVLERELVVQRNRLDVGGMIREPAKAVRCLRIT